MQKFRRIVPWSFNHVFQVHWCFPNSRGSGYKGGTSSADDLYHRRIHVASDCKVVVDDLKKENSSEYGAIIHEIVRRADDFEFCKFSHEFMSSNFEANNLAKHELSLGVGRHVWLGYPGDLPSVPINIVTI